VSAAQSILAAIMTDLLKYQDVTACRQSNRYNPELCYIC
jgi:hypothetical protein